MARRHVPRASRTEQPNDNRLVFRNRLELHPPSLHIGSRRQVPGFALFGGENVGLAMWTGGIPPLEGYLHGVVIRCAVDNISECAEDSPFSISVDSNVD